MKVLFAIWEKATSVRWWWIGGEAHRTASELSSGPIALAFLSEGRDVGFKCSMMASNIFNFMSSSHLTIFAVDSEWIVGIRKEENLIRKGCKMQDWFVVVNVFEDGS